MDSHHQQEELLTASFYRRIISFLRNYDKFIVKTFSQNDFNLIDMKIEIDNVISTLPDKMKDVVMSYFVEDHTMEYVCERMDLKKKDFVFLKREGVKNIAKELLYRWKISQ